MHRHLGSVSDTTPLPQLMQAPYELPTAMSWVTTCFHSQVHNSAAFRIFFAGRHGALTYLCYVMYLKAVFFTLWTFPTLPPSYFHEGLGAWWGSATLRGPMLCTHYNRITSVQEIKSVKLGYKNYVCWPHWDLWKKPILLVESWL